MTIGHILAVLGMVVVVGFIVFAFRQGLKVKPDRNHKPEHNDWQRITGSGTGSDSSSPQP